MKVFIVIMLSLLSFSSVAQMVTTDKEVISLLASVGKEKRIVFKDLRKNIDRAYKALDRVVDHVAANATDKTVSEALRVGIYAASLDSAHTSGMILLNVYTKNKKRVNRLLKKFSAKKSKLLLNHLSAAKKEQEKGNGQL
ncbi:MAG: hypothetical protein KAG61_11470 [Bacteriovoracaceae bacterium]|nr:hypothetical protein [Bacteriovoracaceae bacterium]